MGAAKKLIDKKVLQGLVPLNALSAVHIEEVSRKAVIEDIRPGRYVFKKGDRDYHSVYLLEGTVELIENGRDVVAVVSAGSEEARHPLAHKQPRQLSARASGKATIARVDSNLLDVLLTWDESSGYDVVELDAQEDDDWMTRMLQSQAFLQLPPANIHQLLMRLEAITASAGETVVRQGDDGDYFYIVKSGRLAVSRKASARGKEVLLAELGEGACFGEEALVSETKRNASVTMISDGTLMRLSKEDFNELLRVPLVHEVDFSQARALVGKGAQWLDVRLPGEFDNRSIEGSVNLPLSALREQCATLNRDIGYIVCCDTGRRSSAGAFVLSQRGFDVYTLKDGMMEVPDEVLTRADAEAADGKNGQAAEIIPFESESKPSTRETNENTDAGRQEAAEGALKRQLEEVEADRESLRQQLEQSRKQFGELQAELENAESRNTKGESLQGEFDKLRSELQERERQIEEQAHHDAQEKSGLQGDLDAAKQALDSSQRRFQSLEGEKKLLQEELTGLQQTLSQLQTSKDGRDDALRHELEQMTKRREQDRKEQEKKTHELEQELAQLREDYQQLGQRTSAVAGERDAAVKGLEKMQQDTALLQEQLDVRQAEVRDQLDAAKITLEERDKALADEKNRRRSLEQQLEMTNQRADAGRSRTGELEARITDSEARLAETGRSLQEAADREESLQGQLREAEQKAAEVSQQAQAEKEELERKLGESERLLEESVQGEQQARQQLQQGTESEGEIQKALEQSKADADDVRQQLDAARQQVADSEKQVAELQSRLKGVENEHQSDVASVRHALARAQEECQNVQREQTRLIESLRKAERELEHERHDHETQVRRLQKELKETAGESSAGLAAELEAVQQQLEEGKHHRDELEIQLGERSAQLENLQAESAKLSQQLQQAQDSARQAEQQLVEANQAANEEMTIRLEAEQQTQQTLRDELDGVTGERDQNQEQLTALNQELDGLRNAVQEAQAEAAAKNDSAQGLQEAQGQLQELRAALEKAEQERDLANAGQEQAQQEVDQLRAEAEVTRGLVEMQSSTDDIDEALREELEQTKKNVEVAVRLRGQAEEQARALRNEVDRLHTELGQLRSDEALEVQSPSEDATDEPESRIPSLDENDPHASSLLNTEVDDQGFFQPASDEGELPEEDESGSTATTVLIGTEEIPTAEKPGGHKGLIGGLLVAVVLAAGGFWWFSQKQATDSEFTDVTEAVEEEKQVSSDVQVPQSGSEKARELPKKPVPDKITAVKKVPPVVRGMPEIRKPSPVEKPAEAAKDVTVREPVAEVAAKVDTEPKAGRERGQPIRSFRENLVDGGAAPTMLELAGDSFEMGSGSSSPNFDERPRHTVKLGRFAVSKHEITFDQYDRFAKSTGRARPGDGGWGRGTRPVVNVSWQDAQAYTQWLSRQTGNRYRLPSEAEWEYVARSGSVKRYWWGNKAGQGHANCFDCGGQWAGRSTAPVASFKASALGVHDLSGNAREWVQDCYSQNYSDAPADGSAVESGACTRRVVRGGGYSSPSSKLRSAARDRSAPDTKLDDLGFRVVREF